MLRALARFVHTRAASNTKVIKFGGSSVGSADAVKGAARVVQVRSLGIERKSLETFLIFNY